MFVEGQEHLSPGDVYDFARLQPGNRLQGPAVVHSQITTIVVQPGQSAHMDPWRNLILEAA